jgi:hypothetical protein
VDDDLQEIKNLFGYDPMTADYLTCLSERFKYLYVSTAKVATSSILRQLEFSELNNNEEAVPQEPHDKQATPWLSIRTNMHLFRRAIGSNDFFKFCFVRNPYTRALSCYLDKFVQNEWERARLSPILGLSSDGIPTFYEFLLAVRAQPPGERDIHWESQAFHLRPSVVNYSFIGRFEHFQDDMGKVVELLGLTPYSGKKDIHATNSGKLLNQYYGPGEKKLVRQIYRDDFLTFGYGFSIELA